jgi:hypothetical protein
MEDSLCASVHSKVSSNPSIVFSIWILIAAHRPTQINLFRFQCGFESRQWCRKKNTCKDGKLPFRLRIGFWHDSPICFPFYIFSKLPFLHIFEGSHIFFFQFMVSQQGNKNPFGGLSTCLKKGLSFITNRQRQNEGTFCASELAGIEPIVTPSAPKGAGYVRLDHSACLY